MNEVKDNEGRMISVVVKEYSNGNPVVVVGLNGREYVPSHDGSYYIPV